jgi:hypothetical protein
MAVLVVFFVVITILGAVSICEYFIEKKAK